MTQHVYPNSAMVGDYLRAAAGFVPTAAILAIAPVGAVGGSVLGGLAALFSLFGVRTALRHRSRVEMTATGLSASGPLGTSIRWGELDGLKLAYYSTRRDRRDGWMQLELRAGSSRIRFDSRINGFNELVARAANAAEARGIELSAATAANLEALGIEARTITSHVDASGVTA
jgi:hypothetical protein